MFDIRKQFVISDKIQKMIYEIQDRSQESESNIIRRAIIELHEKETKEKLCNSYSITKKY